MQLAVNSAPAWAWIGAAREREQLQAENARLRAGQRDLECAHALRGPGARERRAARTACGPATGRRALARAEIVNVQLSSLRQRLLIDRGAVNKFQAQAVLDDRGLIGQTTHVGPGARKSS